MNYNIANDVKKSFVITWIIISVIIFSVLISPFILNEKTIYSISPRCEWKTKYNRECILCGSTRAFIEISNGRIYNAFAYNKLSLAIYSIFILNELSIIILFINKLLMKKFINKNLRSQKCRY
jgi:hypothetical protein